MRGLKLRQVETFCELARQGSLALTAEKLSLTQSAVSLSVRELERQLGEALFNKQGRRLVLSERGRELLPDALEILERAESFGEGSRDAGATEASQPLAIGATRSIGPHLLPRLIEAFERSRPAGQRQRYELYIQNTEAVLARLEARSLDVAFVEGEVPDPQLHKTVWLPDQLAIFCRSQHPALRARQRLPALAQASWALREPGSGTRETVLRALAPLLPAMQVDLEATDNATLAEAVAQSDRIGALSRRAIAAELANGRLAEIRAQTLDASGALAQRLSRHFWLVRHPQRYQRRAVSDFLAHAQDWRDG